jgi:hypothetical protein
LPTIQNGSSALRECLKRKASDSVEETHSRKLPTLENYFERRSRKRSSAMEENPLPEEIEVSVQIKEENEDEDPVALVIDSLQPDTSNQIRFDGDSEDESDNDPALGFFNDDWPNLPTMENREEFVCEMENCGKTFTSQWHLQRHGVTHIENRPYACGSCSKSYKRRSHLVRHQKKSHYAG